MFRPYLLDLIKAKRKVKRCNNKQKDREQFRIPFKVIQSNCAYNRVPENRKNINEHYNNSILYATTIRAKSGIKFLTIYYAWSLYIIQDFSHLLGSLKKPRFQQIIVIITAREKPGMQMHIS